MEAGYLDICGKEAVYTRPCLTQYCSGDGVFFEKPTIGDNFAQGSCTGTGVYMTLTQKDTF